MKPSAERRRTERIRKRFSARLEVEGCEEKGIILNLSEHGAFIQSRKVHNAGTLVGLFIADPSGGEIGVAGKVVFVKNPSSRLGVVESGGMGIAFLSISEEVKTFLQRCRT